MTKLINYFLVNSKDISQIIESIGIILILITFIYLLVAYKDKKSKVKIESIKTSIAYILILSLVAGMNINLISNMFLYVGHKEIEKVEVTKKNEIDLKERIETVKENINKFISPNNESNIIGKNKMPSKINTFNKDKSN